MSSKDLSRVHSIQSYRENISKYGRFFEDLDTENAIKFIDYIEGHPDQAYFPIYKLKEASGYDDLDSIISLVTFFSDILSIEYIYQDGEEEKSINKESIKEYQSGDGFPVFSESGLEVENFDPSNFSFYCYLDE